MQRRLTIRSNPPGALVRIDNHDIGITPCSTDYIYYGTRHIQLVRDGYETLSDYRWIGPPWYEIPPIDAISENAIPWEIRDERIIDYTLLPQQVVPTQQLLGRAENLRQSTRLDAAAAVPAAPAQPGTIFSGPPAQSIPIPGSYPAAPSPLSAPPGYPPRSYPLPSPNAPPSALPPLANPQLYSPPGGFQRQSSPLPPAGPR